MASRTPSRRSSGGRSSSRSSSSSSPKIGSVGLVGAGLVVVIFIGVMVAMKSGGDDKGEKPADKPQVKTPAKQPSKPMSPMKLGAAQAGKTPDKPAPAMTVEMLQEMRDGYQAAKKLSDEGIRLRKESKNMEARAKMAEAKVKIDAIKAMIDKQLTWQEEADFGDWAQPAEYTTMSAIYGKIARLDKTVRMNGGK